LEYHGQLLISLPVWMIDIALWLVSISCTLPGWVSYWVWTFITQSDWSWREWHGESVGGTRSSQRRQRTNLNPQQDSWSMGLCVLAGTYP